MKTKSAGFMPKPIEAVVDKMPVVRRVRVRRSARRSARALGFLSGQSLVR